MPNEKSNAQATLMEEKLKRKETPPHHSLSVEGRAVDVGEKRNLKSGNKDQ